MQVTGIIKNKARVLPRVIYLDVETGDGPKKQWVLFKDKHTYQDIQTISNAEPGATIIIDGKDNINKQTGQPQIVVNSLINLIPDGAALTNTNASFSSPSDKKEQIQKDLQFLMRQLPKEDAIVMLAAQILKVSGS
jgi:hypothetical protein